MWRNLCTVTVGKAYDAVGVKLVVALRQHNQRLACAHARHGNRQMSIANGKQAEPVSEQTNVCSCAAVQHRTAAVVDSSQHTLSEAFQADSTHSVNRNTTTPTASSFNHHRVGIIAATPT